MYKNESDSQLKTSAQTEKKKIKEYVSFEAMNLKSELLKGIYSCGFDKPSVVQSKSIMQIILGKDVVAQSQSGTGKTATFSISILQVINTNSKELQAIILSPSRELAIQSKEVIESLAGYMKISAFACVGGDSIKNDLNQFKNGLNIISGTPGRLHDIIKRHKISLQNVVMLVLDEADELLSDENKKTLARIYCCLPPGVQVVVVSATLPPELLQCIALYTNDPVKILLDTHQWSLSNIKQFYVQCQNEEWKLDSLCDIYNSLLIARSIIFCHSRAKVIWLAASLISHNFPAVPIHGALSQSQRNSILRNFRAGNTRILISTDIWARGIDVPLISLVVNYDLPLDKHIYLHRIGRSGRFGRVGFAVNLINRDQISFIKLLEKSFKMNIKRLPKNFLFLSNP